MAELTGHMEREPWALSVLIAFTCQCQGPSLRLLSFSQLPLAPVPLPAKSPGLTYAVVYCLQSPPMGSTGEGEGEGKGGRERWGEREGGEEGEREG